MADSFDREDVRERPPVAELVEAPREADPLADVASLVGNRAVGGLLARDGAGILPGGLVHLDVETTVAGTRGGGAQLEPATREQEVLRLVADGHPTREVAERLCYSERTIKNVMHDVVTKLHARTRSQAIAHAVRDGLI